MTNIFTPITAAQADSDSPIDASLIGSIKGNLDFLYKRAIILKSPPVILLTRTSACTWTDLTITPVSPEVPGLAFLYLSISTDTSILDHVTMYVRKYGDSSWIASQTGTNTCPFVSNSSDQTTVRQSFAIVPLDVSYRFQYSIVRTSSSGTPILAQILLLGYMDLGV